MPKMTQLEQVLEVGMKMLLDPKPQVRLLEAKSAVMDSMIKGAVADDKYHLARGLKTRTAFFSKKIDTE